MTATSAPVRAMPRQAPRVAPRNMARLLWVELRRNAMPFVLPLIAVLFWFDSYRIAATMPPLWVERLYYILGQGHALIDFAPFVAGVAAWMGSRDGRRGMTDLVTATVRPRWEAQLATWAATVVWAVGAYLVFMAVTLGLLGRSIDYGSPPWWPVAVGAVGVAAFTSAGFALGAYFPGRFIAPIAAFGALFAMGTSSQIGFSEGSGWALILPTMSNNNFGQDAGIFYQFLPDVPIARVMFCAGVARGGGGPARPAGERGRAAAAAVRGGGHRGRGGGGGDRDRADLDRPRGALRRGHSGAARRGQRPADPVHPGLRPGRDPGLCAPGLPVLPAGRDDRGGPGGSESSPACPVPRSGPPRSPRSSRPAARASGRSVRADRRAAPGRDHRRQPAGAPHGPQRDHLAAVRSGWTTSGFTGLIRLEFVHAFIGAGGGPGTPAQQVVQAALLQDAGTPLAAQPNVLGFSPWALPGQRANTRRTSYPPQLAAAAQRFAALPAAARHAWLAAHLGALRAGHITPAQLP